MMHDARFLQFIDVIQNAVLLKRFPIFDLVQTVDKPIVDVVRLQLRKLRLDRPLHRIRIQGPSVNALGILRPEVDLVKYILSGTCQRRAEDRIGVAVSRCQIKYIDPAFHGALQRPDAFVHSGFK